MRLLSWIPLLSALVTLFGSDACAREWTFRPSMSLTETSTDNVLLAPSRAEGDVLTSLEPGLSVTGRTRRLKVSTYYRMQSRNYWDHSELNDVTHFLGANSTFEVVRNNLFVDGFASLFPTHQNTFGRLSNRNSRNVGENQVDVSNYGVTPRFQYRLGSIADFRASLRYTKTDTGTIANNISQVAGSSTGYEQNVRLSSIPHADRLDWFVSYERQREVGESGISNNSTFERSDVGANFKLNRFFTLTSTVGYEQNDSSGGGSNSSGATWSLGGIVTPSPRTKIGGRFAHRAFGDTKSFDFSYRLRRVIINGTYTEELRTSAQLLRQQRVFQTQDVFGNPIANPNLDANIPLPINLLGLRNDVFIARTFNANIGFQQQRGLLTLGVFRTEQSTAGSTVQNADTLLGTTLNWNHDFGYRLSGGFSADYQTRSNASFAGTQDSVYISPYFSYRLGAHLNSRLSYSYAEETSGQALDTLFGGGYVENSVSATLSYTY